MPKKLVAMCYRCGITKACELIQDPYLVEVCPEEEVDYEWWCDNCADERRDDV